MKTDNYVITAIWGDQQMRVFSFLSHKPWFHEDCSTPFPVCVYECVCVYVFLCTFACAGVCVPWECKRRALGTWLSLSILLPRDRSLVLHPELSAFWLAQLASKAQWPSCLCHPDLVCAMSVFYMSAGVQTQVFTLTERVHLVTQPSLQALFLYVYWAIYSSQEEKERAEQRGRNKGWKRSHVINSWILIFSLQNSLHLGLLNPFLSHCSSGSYTLSPRGDLNAGKF